MCLMVLVCLLKGGCVNYVIKKHGLELTLFIN
jgi:hypothetical protein